MEIFNKQIFGSDADYFVNELSIIEKINWIKANTNQQNEDLICEFIENLTRGKDVQCLNCGINDSNISKANVIEVATDSNDTMAKESSARNSTKRRKPKK
jgi:hypothetical protein